MGRRALANGRPARAARRHLRALDGPPPPAPAPTTGACEDRRAELPPGPLALDAASQPIDPAAEAEVAAALLLDAGTLDGSTAKELDAAVRRSPLAIEALCEGLYRYATARERRQAEIAQRLGLGVTESSALLHLRIRGPATPRQLGELLSITSGGITALLRRLEHHELVERLAHPRDRRSSRVAITARGEAAAKELSDPLINAIYAGSQELSDDERCTITRWLTGIVTELANEIGSSPRQNGGSPARDGDTPADEAPAPTLWH